MSEEKPRQQGVSRPTGKRQLAGVSATSTSSYQAKHAPVEPEEKAPNPILSFFPQVVEEMRKVIWPTARQMVNYTIIVFSFLILLTALVAGVDFIAGLGVEKVLSR